MPSTSTGPSSQWSRSIGRWFGNRGWEVLFRVGTSYIQLVGSLGPDTPVGKFLEKRGEGVHHVGYRVADVAAVLERLRAKGVPLVDQMPRPGSRGTTVAFVHPRGFRGVLVELVQEGPLPKPG